MSSSPITLLDLTNKILLRLREEKVQSTADSTYTQMLVQFINDAKREVEDAYNWENLKTTLSTTMTASDNTLALSNIGGVYTTPRTRVTEVYLSGLEQHLLKTSRDNIRRWQQDTSSEGQPTFWAMGLRDSNDNVTLEFHQTPDQAYAVDITCYNPDEDFIPDTNDTKVFKVPSHPVYLRALALAMRERGDDSGMAWVEVNREYQFALGDAVAYEQRTKYDGTGFAGDWYVP